MTFIEGVGNEVTIFFTVLLILIIIIFSWMSTQVSNNLTLYSIENQFYRIGFLDHGFQEASGDNQTSISNVEEEVLPNASPHHTDGHGECEEMAVESQEEGTIIEPCEAHPLSSDRDENVSTQGEATANTEGSVERAAIIDTSSGENISVAEPETQQDLANSSEGLPQEEGHVRIRLKYLNDSQKLVQGRLQEQVGQFKQRHFAVEMAANKLVKLVFNGQLLDRNTNTLEHYGIFDNCVVHCLISSVQSPAGAPSAQSSEDQNDFNISIALFPLIIIIIAIFWYLRFTYPGYFNSTSTLALVGLTGFFFLTVAAFYPPNRAT